MSVHLNHTKSVTSTTCGWCDSTPSKFYRCSICHIEKYCGRECQRSHWPTHKKVCQIKPTLVEKTTPVPGLRLFENFISSDLHDKFVAQMDRGVPEQNNGHYDGYDFPDYEAFDAAFYPLVKDVFAKLRELDFFSGEKDLKLACTLIGYEKDGYITRHVDSQLVSGGTVILVSFLSPVVVNFYSEKGTKEHHKIFVPPRSMYVISGEARYKWSHEILPDETSYDSTPFERGRRYAILFTPPGPLRTGEELLEFS